MFDINDFYEKAEKGIRIDETELSSYLNSFQNLIIWGAGNLGTALGAYCIKNRIKIAAYWDARYKELESCNGIKVIQTFTGEFEPEKTLVIIGIVNGTLSHKWQIKELKKNGFSNYLLGMQMYEGAVCKMHIGEKLDVSKCTGTSICNFNTCKKYMSILEEDCKQDDKISIQVLEFIISRRCTLHCKNCGQWENTVREKFPEKYMDYSLERIKKDIDICMDNIDVVGTFSIIGGEPFMHPNLVEIIEHCLSKKNVAIISITTNGIWHANDEMLQKMKNDRVKINFSNYTQTLDASYKTLFNTNVEKIKRLGLNCNVSTPVWNSVSSELVEKPDCSGEYLDLVKQNCVMGPSVANGIFYGCPTIETYSKTEMFPVNEYIELTTADNMKDRIRELVSRTHYKACGFRCGNGTPAKQVIPGEQQ